MNAPEQLKLNLDTGSINKLNTKAMLVRLSISKPATSKRDANAEQFTQQSLGDAGLRVNATLFKDKHSPVRRLLNEATAVYHYHKQNTLPYIDRGPRLLPVANYEKYRDDMRRLVADVDNSLRALMPNYSQHVAADIVARGARAAATDYPDAATFEAAFKLSFTFSPLPDSDHFLFDITQEDKDALQAQLDEVAQAAREDMRARVSEPLRHLLDKLKVPAGTPGSIFRDSAVENILESVTLVRSLAMGDPEILDMCNQVAAAMSGYASNPQVLRESPIVREQTVTKLNDVAQKMGFLFGA